MLIIESVIIPPSEQQIACLNMKMGGARRLIPSGGEAEPFYRQLKETD
jgi:hypothetical protein